MMIRDRSDLLGWIYTLLVVGAFLLIICIALLVHLSNESVVAENILLVADENLSFVNGGVSFNFTDGLEWCHETGSFGILCGTDTSGCWDYKKDYYVGKVFERSSCTMNIDDSNQFTCIKFMRGEFDVVDDSIDLYFDHYECYFEQRGDDW